MTAAALAAIVRAAHRRIVEQRYIAGRWTPVAVIMREIPGGGWR